MTPGRPFTGINDTHHKFKLETAELRADLLAEGLIEPPRYTGSVNGGCIKYQATSDAERAAIDAFMATKAPRHFAYSDSGDDFHICAMLRTRGHKIFRTVAEGHRSIKYNLDGKVISRAAFIAFVDALRDAMGLPPMGTPA